MMSEIFGVIKKQSWKEMVMCKELYTPKEET